MSERYSLIGHQAALLLGICLLTVWEMSAPVDAYRGEYMETANCLQGVLCTCWSGLGMQLMCLALIYTSPDNGQNA